MNCGAFLVGSFLVLSCSVQAQVDSKNAFLGESSNPQPAYLAGTSKSTDFFPAAPGAFAAFPEPLPASEPAFPQEVQGVFASSNWQGYAGYAYTRFYAFPGTAANENGAGLSLAYYFKGGWLGAEGQLVATFGSVSGKTSAFLVGAGGPKARWPTASGVELWAHGLVGGAHFTPQTPYGGEGSFAYELGGGVDIPSHHRRLAYRVEADIVGTRFFSTYQYSPSVSAGIVYKF